MTQKSIYTNVYEKLTIDTNTIEKLAASLGDNLFKLDSRGTVDGKEFVYVDNCHMFCSYYGTPLEELVASLNINNIDPEDKKDGKLSVSVRYLSDNQKVDITKQARITWSEDFCSRELDAFLLELATKVVELWNELVEEMGV